MFSPALPNLLRFLGEGKNGTLSTMLQNGIGLRTPSFNAYQNHKVFCVVRDPLDRALSEFKQRTFDGNNFTKAAAQEWLVNTVIRLARRRKNSCRGDCHLFPQFHYILDNDDVSISCDHGESGIRTQGRTFLFFMFAVVNLNKIGKQIWLTIFSCVRPKQCCVSRAAETLSNVTCLTGTEEVSPSVALSTP